MGIKLNLVQGAEMCSITTTNSTYKFYFFWHFRLFIIQLFKMSYMCSNCNRTFSSDQELFQHRRNCGNGNRMSSHDLCPSRLNQNQQQYRWYSWLLRSLTQWNRKESTLFACENGAKFIWSVQTIWLMN